MQRLENWSDKWLLRFSAAKCKVMHIGHNTKTKYFLHDNGLTTELEEVGEERDLGVLVSEDLKPSKQCVAAANKARPVLGMIYRHFKVINKRQFLTLYKTYVCPHLKYCIQAWSPSLRKDIDCLANVHRRATEMVSGLKKLSYMQRLKRLNLTTLEERRKRGDLIERYKLLTKRRMWIISNSFGRRKISTRYEVIVTRCSFLASEQISGNHFSATEPWTSTGCGIKK